MDKLRNASSKLGSINKDSMLSKNDIGLIKKKRNLEKIKTFRFSDDELKNLEKIRELVNQESKSYITDTKIIRALIQIGTKLDANKILRALAEIL